MSYSSFPFPKEATDALLQWTATRIKDGPDATHGAQAFAELEPILGKSITQDGLGADQAIRMFTDTIVPSTRPFGHPTSLSFVASAASPASLSFDAALGAAGDGLLHDAC